MTYVLQLLDWSAWQNCVCSISSFGLSVTYQPVFIEVWEEDWIMSRYGSFVLMEHFIIKDTT